MIDWISMSMFNFHVLYFSKKFKVLPSVVIKKPQSKYVPF